MNLTSTLPNINIKRDSNSRYKICVVGIVDVLHSACSHEDIDEVLKNEAEKSFCYPHIVKQFLVNTNITSSLALRILSRVMQVRQYLDGGKTNIQICSRSFMKN